MKPTYPQVLICGIIFAAVILSAKFAPQAEVTVSSLAFSIVGALFLTKRNEDKANAQSNQSPPTR